MHSRSSSFYNDTYGIAVIKLKIYMTFLLLLLLFNLWCAVASLWTFNAAAVIAGSKYETNG